MLYLDKIQRKIAERNRRTKTERMEDEIERRHILVIAKKRYDMVSNFLAELSRNNIRLSAGIRRQ